MSKAKLLLVLLIPALLVSCNKSSQPGGSGGSSEDFSEGEATFSIPPEMAKETKKEGYNVTVTYKDSYFEGSTTTSSKDLQMLSFGASCTSSLPEKAKVFFDGMHFDNQVAYGYDDNSENGIAYYIAHKKMANFDLISVSIRSFIYEKEWANNFILGKEGNHKGFQDVADKVYESLKSYIQQSYSDKTYKLWLSGYSRGGAVSSLLAVKLMEQKELPVTQDNLFVYTFETPHAFAEENIKEYPNIINFVNKYDVVAQFPPEQYGLYRVGQDQEIFKDNVGELLTAFDPNLSIPAFTPSEEENGYKTPQEFIDYLLDILLKPIEDEEYIDYSCATREEYVDHYQEAISYFVGMYFTLTEANITHIKEKFESLGIFDKMALIGELGIYNFLKPILDEDKVEYIDEKLKSATEAARLLIMSHPTILALLMGPTELTNNIKYIISMHYPETTYALIK